MKHLFRKIANKISAATGTAGAFLLALGVVIVWAFTGQYFNYSDTWQLVINTGTTIVTFLMVFLIQNTQNRDSKAMQLKLDELINSSRTARNTFVGLEELTDEDLVALDLEFKAMHDEKETQTALGKLHKKIAAEHHRRLTLRQQAGQVISLLDPRKLASISTDSNSKPASGSKSSSSQK